MRRYQASILSFLLGGVFVAIILATPNADVWLAGLVAIAGLVVLLFLTGTLTDGIRLFRQRHR